MSPDRPAPFGERLAAVVGARGPLTVGIEPHPPLLRDWGLPEDAAGLERFGMTVVEAKVEEFRKVAQQKIWPAYKSQYGALWDEIEGFKV